MAIQLQLLSRPRKLPTVSQGQEFSTSTRKMQTLQYASIEALDISLIFSYGGNPVSCAIASAVLDVIEDEKVLQKRYF